MSASSSNTNGRSTERNPCCKAQSFPAHPGGSGAPGDYAQLERMSFRRSGGASADVGRRVGGLIVDDDDFEVAPLAAQSRKRTPDQRRLVARGNQHGHVCGDRRRRSDPPRDARACDAAATARAKRLPLRQAPRHWRAEEATSQSERHDTSSANPARIHDHSLRVSPPI